MWINILEQKLHLLNKYSKTFKTQSITTTENK